MLVTRQHFEAGLLVATTLQLGHSLLTQGHAGWQWDLGALFALTFLAILQEHSCAGLLKGGRFVTRKAESQGTALGALTVPWTFASLVAYTLKHSRHAEFSTFAFRASVGSSSAMLACFAMSSNPVAVIPKQMKAAHGPRQIRKVGPGRPAHSSTSRAGALILPGALALVVALAVSAPLMQGVSSWGTPDGFQWGRLQMNGTSAAIGVAVNTTAGAGGVHLMLTHLPKCFTLGEAMVVSQAIVILALDVALVAFSAGAAVFGFYAAAESPAGSSGKDFTVPGFGEQSPMQLFVELLLFAALVIGFASAPLLRSIFREWKGSTRDSGGMILGSRPLQKASRTAAKGCAPARLISDGETCGKHPAKLSAEATIIAAANCNGIDAEASSRSARPANGVHGSQGGSQGLLRHLRMLRDRRVAALGVILGLACMAAVKPALWALSFALGTPRRVCVLGYWVAVLALALPFMDWISRMCAVPTIIVRKGYHLLALALFAPALILEPQLLAISLAIACALLVVVEVLRVGNVPVVGPRIHRFMTSFIDARDSGVLLVSHFSLLVGMAVPVWLSATSSKPAYIPDVAAAFAGIITLGVSDSAASALGRRYGKLRILGTDKTVEGTAGGMLCTLLAWGVLMVLCPSCAGHRTWSRIVIATVSSCLLEAATTQLDNLFLPLHHFAMLVS